MKSRILLLASVLFLGIGINTIFDYGKGTAGFSAAYPVDGARFELSIATTGVAAIAGFSLTLFGVFLLLLAIVIDVVIICRAIVSRSRRKPARELDEGAAV
jgi:uncharacterized membrane protein